MNSKARFSFVFVSFLFFFGLILLRLFFWQVIRGGELAALAQNQYKVTYEDKARRGNLYFQDKSPFVINQPGFLVVGLPQEMKDKKQVVHTLSPILKIDEASIAGQLSDELYWVALKHKIDEETKQKIASFNLAGIGFQEEPFRFYPEASMGAHLTGFIGADINGVDKGYFGLEGFYDRELRGRNASVKSFIDALGRPILLGVKSEASSVPGRDLVLHIDRTIQFIVEERLKKGFELYGAKGGTVIVMDPKTGNVLAMASQPSYDQGKWHEFDQTLYKNPAVAGAYEPGSTFKVLVMTAAMSEGVVEAQTRCDICSGSVSIGGFTIRTFNDKYFENTTMLEVIEHSDNTGMVFVTKKLGLEKLYRYLEAFGIGKLTGIDLEDEESPRLRPQGEWREIDLATAGFGQGVAVTPIQMVTAISAIANGGKLMQPSVVAHVIDEDGKEHTIEPKVKQVVISEKAAKVVTEMMVNAVENGEAKLARIKGYRIAGKTGTAQIPIAGHYDPTKTIASFVGFAPADDPKFVILVKLDEPSSYRGFGSSTAAPLFFEITRSLLTYYNIPPSR